MNARAIRSRGYLWNATARIEELPLKPGTCRLVVADVDEGGQPSRS